MKTNELIGAELDYWVAKAEGWNVAKASGDLDGRLMFVLDHPDRPACVILADSEPYSGPLAYAPSRNWAHGGPIIERLPRIRIQLNESGYSVQTFMDESCLIPTYGYGDTILIAAMRCCVASKFGDEVSG